MSATFHVLVTRTRTRYATIMGGATTTVRAICTKADSEEPNLSHIALFESPDDHRIYYRNKTAGERVVKIDDEIVLTDDIYQMVYWEHKDEAGYWPQDALIVLVQGKGYDVELYKQYPQVHLTVPMRATKEDVVEAAAAALSISTGDITNFDQAEVDLVPTFGEGAAEDTVYDFGEYSDTAPDLGFVEVAERAAPAIVAGQVWHRVQHQRAP